METPISKTSPIPIYQQVSDWILAQINNGAWPEHYQLPSENDLADQLSVNRGTLRKAIAQLRQNGKLVAIHGRGTFVAATTLEQPLAGHLVAFSEDLISKGIAYQTRVLDQRCIKPEQAIDSLLAAHGQPVFFLHRVRSIQEKPIILLENYVACAHCPGIEQDDFTENRLFDTLENKYGLELSWGWRTFEARSATAEIARMLGGVVCDPVMYMEQLVYLKSGVPIEYSRVWLKGDSFRLSAQVKREKSANDPVNMVDLLR